MSLQKIRARLGSISKTKMAQIDIVSPTAARILKDVGLLLRIVGATQSLLSEENLNLEELACFNAYFILSDVLEELEQP